MKRIILDIHKDYACLLAMTFVGMNNFGTKVSIIAEDIRKYDHFTVAADGKITATASDLNKQERS